MSIPFVVAEAPAWTQSPLLPLTLAPLALLLAARVGVFRGRSIDGPTRFDSASESPGRLWLIALIGFAVWMTVPLVYMAAAHGAELEELQRVSSTESAEDHAPTRQSAATVLKPRELVALGLGSQVLALVVLLLADARLLKPGGLRRLGIAGANVRRALGPGAIGAAIALPITWLVAAIVQWTWVRVGFRPPQDHELIRMLRQSPPTDLKLLVTASATLCAPVFEEALFRGHLQTAFFTWLTSLLRPVAPSSGGFEVVPDGAHAPAPLDPELQSHEAPTWPRWTAIAITALAFALVHEAGWMIPPLFVLAVCLGYAYERTANLWVPILMHAMFNLVSVTVVLLG